MHEYQELGRTLNSALSEIYTGSNVSSSRRQDLEAWLEQLKNAEGSWTQACGLLSLPAEMTSPFVQFFSLGVMEHCLKNQRVQLNTASQTAVFLSNLLQNHYHALSQYPFVRAKMAQVCVLSGLCEESLDGPFLRFLLSTFSPNSDPATVPPHSILLLSTAIETYVSKDLRLHSSRCKVLQQVFAAHLPEVVHILQQILQNGIKSFQMHDTIDPECIQVLGLTLQSLLVIWTWAPLNSELLKEDILFPLFSLIEIAAQSPLKNVVQIASLGISCLTEILSKKLIPAELQSCVMSIADHMLKLLNSLSQVRREMETDECFLMAMSEFVASFVEHHFSVLVKTPSYPLGDFLQVLAAFTFRSQDPTHVMLWLKAWKFIASFLATEETAIDSGLLIGLSSMSKTLYRSILFSSNAEGLSLLSTEDSGVERKGSAEEALELVLLLEEQEMDNMWNSELGDYIKRCRDLLLTLAQLPTVSQALTQFLMNDLNEVHTSLNTENMSAQLSTAYDAATICSLLPIIFFHQNDPCSLIQVSNGLIQWVTQMVQSRVYSRGKVFEHLEVCGVSAVSYLIPSLSALSLSNPELAEQVLSMVELIAQVVVSSLDCSVSPPPEAVLKATTSLLHTVSSQLSPALLLKASFPGKLAAEISSLATPLPQNIQVRLYVGLSKCLLPPSLLHGECKRIPDFEARLSALSSTVLTTLASQLQVLMNSPTMILSELISLTTACRVAAAVIHSLATSPAHFKSVLMNFPCTQSLAQAGGHVLVCCLSQVTQALISGNIARPPLALVELMVALIRTLRKELGAEYIANCVGGSVQALRMENGEGFLLLNSKRGLAVICCVASLLETALDSPSIRLPRSTLVDICRVTLKQLAPSVLKGYLEQQQLDGHKIQQEASAELTPRCLEIAEKVLKNYWDSFTFIQGGSRLFRDPEMEHLFFGIMELITDALRASTNAPGVVMRVILMLSSSSNANCKHICSFDPFRERVSPFIIGTLLQNVTSQSECFLQEEQTQLLFELLCEQSKNTEQPLEDRQIEVKKAIINQFLPDTLELSDPSKKEVMDSWSKVLQCFDQQNFVICFKDFLHNILLFSQQF